MRALVVPFLLATTLFVEPARAAASDAASAQQILTEVTGSPQAPLAVREVESARKSLERAQSARDAGDSKHAELLEGLARTWAESARDLLRAARTEQEARELQEKSATARAQAERDRALLEETLASRDRARADLERANAEAAARAAAPPPREKGRGKGKKARKNDEPKKAEEEEMRAFALLAGGAFALLAGCTHMSRPAVLGDAALARQNPASVEAAELAPTSFAEAEKIRRDAEAAYDAGDPSGAQILGEQAVAAYARAFLHARIARATRALDEAKTEETAASGELSRLKEEQTRASAEVTDLETRIKVAHDALPVVASGEADAPREKARLEAARALATEARLLCASTRMLAPDTEGLKAADQAATALTQALVSSPKPAPIDDAMRARAGCLATLGQAKRTAAAAPGAASQDGSALLAELAREGTFAPLRDERGVVVTIPEAFAGAEVSRSATPRLELAAKIAAAHPTIPLLVVVHEAEGKDTKRGAQRAEAVKKLFGKARTERVEVVSAGSSRPVIDPSQKKDQGRNDRVEVVFVDAGG